MSDPTLNNRFVSSRDAVVDDHTPSKQEFHITTNHCIQDWRPAKLLCKRFSLRDPYKSLPDVQAEEKGKTDTTGQSSVSSLDGIFGADRGDTKRNLTNLSSGNEIVDLDLEELEKEFVDPLQNVKQADVDLFSELFG